MKKLLYLLPVLLILSAFFYSCSPKVYSTAADTVNLNKEYRVLLRDVVNLNGDINKLKSNIPVLEAKAQKADAKSKKSLEESRRQAAMATGGELKQSLKRMMRRMTRKILKQHVKSWKMQGKVLQTCSRNLPVKKPGYRNSTGRKAALIRMHKGIVPTVSSGIHNFSREHDFKNTRYTVRLTMHLQ
jgi:hypothetical protein